MRVVHLKREAYTHQVSRPAPLGNPFSHRPSKFHVIYVPSRAKAIDLWEQYARNDPYAVSLIRDYEVQHPGAFKWLAKPEEMMQLIHNLPEDAVLGCWCAPDPCHADVIMTIWKELHGKL